MNKYTCVVWDWNGTLLDDVDANLRTANRMLSRRGLHPIDSRNTYRNLFCFPVIDFYRKVGFDLEADDFNALAEEYVKVYTEEAASAKLACGAVEALEVLSSRGVRQVIISATEHYRLRDEVASHSVSDTFYDVLGVGDNLGASKKAVAQKFVAESGFPPSEILFIGDTAHDSEVAEACGCDCVLISSGHFSAENLERTGRPVISRIEEAVELVI